MDLKDAYHKVARRSMESADTLLNRGIQESSAFYSYHAFESIGGALCESRGMRYHPLSHHNKINQFKLVAGRCGVGTGVAKVALIVASVRNGCLYPNQASGGAFETPDQHITVHAAGDMLRRVKGICRVVERVL